MGHNEGPSTGEQTSLHIELSRLFFFSCMLWVFLLQSRRELIWVLTGNQTCNFCLGKTTSRKGFKQWFPWSFNLWILTGAFMSFTATWRICWCRLFVISSCWLTMLWLWTFENLQGGVTMYHALSWHFQLLAVLNKWTNVFENLNYLYPTYV